MAAMPSRHPEQYQTMLARLREARLAVGLRQDDVAERLGVRQTLISKIELGDRRIDPVELAELADLFGVSVDWLIRGDSEPERGASGTEPPAPGVEDSAAIEPQTVTRLLHAWSAGSADALNALMPAVYDELRILCERALARRRAITLMPTELAHEAYLKFAQGDLPPEFSNRRRFYAYAVTTIWRIVADHIRSASAEKRGGGFEEITIASAGLSAQPLPIAVLDLHSFLERLETSGKETEAGLIRCKLLGLTEAEIAGVLGVSPATVHRQWQSTRRLLASEFAL